MEINGDKLLWVSRDGARHVAVIRRLQKRMAMQGKSKKEKNKIESSYALEDAVDLEFLKMAVRLILERL